MDKIRLEFEDWYSQQKLDPHASWHPAESLQYDRHKYPNGRYTVMSGKQSAWEVWQACWVRAQEVMKPKVDNDVPVCEVIESPEGIKVKVSYMVAPHNSSRNHADVEVESEEEVKESGITYIPCEDGVYWTAEQILQYMLKNLRGEDIIEILNCKKEADMIQFHHSVGRWIRNTFKLWDPKNPHLDGMHPDEMSTEILKGIWRAVIRREMIGM